MPPDRGGDILAQLEVMLEHPVGMVEELDLVDPHHGRARQLLTFAERAGIGRVHAVNARFPSRGQHVDDLSTLIGPASDRPGSPVLQIIGMCDNGKRLVPIAWHRGEFGHLKATSITSAPVPVRHCTS